MTENEITTTYRTKSVLVDMADRYGMEPGPFESTVRAICMPLARKEKKPFGWGRKAQ